MKVMAVGLQSICPAPLLMLDISSKIQILVALTVVQVLSRASCSPSYVIESYSKVRVQQPSVGLSVESHTPLDIMLNPNLADEPPTVVDKMESIFMKSEPMRNVKSTSADEKEIVESINKQIAPLKNANEKEASILDERDFIPTGLHLPTGFSVATETTTTSTSTEPPTSSTQPPVSEEATDPPSTESIQKSSEEPPTLSEIIPELLPLFSQSTETSSQPLTTPSTSPTQEN